MTRLIAAVTAGLLALVLTGCGEDSKPVETTTTTTSTTPATETKPADSTTTSTTVEQHPTDTQESH